MRIWRYLSGAAEGWAVLDPDTERWHGCTETSPQFPGSVAELIGRGDNALEAAAAVMRAQPALDSQSLRSLPPLGKPSKIICVGLNYVDHSAESGFEQPAYPTLFSRFSTSLVAHNEPIAYPSVSDSLDYEGELAVIIGKPGKSVSRANALDHVLGYSIFNDASVRDYQFKTPQWIMGKNFDATGAFGPYLVTSDELPIGAKGLNLETRLNGQTVQSANTRDMVFDVESLIVIISEVMTLEAGDVIVAGTPAGVGFGREPKLYMKPGDVCEVEIEGIGVLRSPVQRVALA